MPKSENTIPSLIATAWRTAPPVLRRFAYWVWSIGFVAVTLSVFADVQDWWGGLQFTTNIVAELTCGMVALPIALVIIARLAEYQVQELERVRLEARYEVALDQLNASLGATIEYVQNQVQEVTSCTNAFVTAAKVVNGSLADPARARESALHLQDQMDSRQWLFYERIVTPVRIDGNQFRGLLRERTRIGEPTDEPVRFERIWTALESALRHQRQTMTDGYHEFAQGAPTAERANRLRDAAISHVHSVDHVLQLCAELAAFADQAQPLPAGDARPGQPGLSRLRPSAR